MERINNIETPYTLRTFNTSNGGEYILKGTKEPVKYTSEGGIRQNESNFLKLYKREKIDDLDTFRLVAQKEEKYILNPNEETKELSLIRKELFNPKTNALFEQSEIATNVGGGKTIQCNGDVFKMSGNIATNRECNTPHIDIELSKGKFTAMAKRIIKILSK